MSSSFVAWSSMREFLIIASPTFSSMLLPSSEEPNWFQSPLSLTQEQKDQAKESFRFVLHAAKQIEDSPLLQGPQLSSNNVDLHLTRFIPQVLWLLTEERPVCCDKCLTLENFYNMLAQGYMLLYRRNDRIDEVMRVIDFYSPINKRMPEVLRNHTVKEQVFGNLAIWERERYCRTGLLEDAKRAYILFRKALDLTPMGHPMKYRRGGDAAILLQDLYERTGDRKYLDEAILDTEDNVRNAPPEMSALVNMNVLATLYQQRHELLGDMNDLMASITYAQRVLDNEPNRDEEYGIRKNNLANKYFSRYRRRSDEKDLEKAIELSTEALEFPLTEEGRKVVYSSLGSWFMAKFRRSHDIADIDQSIKWARLGVSDHTRTEQDHPLSIFKLAQALEARYEFENPIPIVSGPEAIWNLIIDQITSEDEPCEDNDLDTAIDHYKRALEILHPDSIDRAKFLIGTGEAIASRYNRSHELRDFEDAVDLYTQAWEQKGSRPLERITAARLLARGYALQKDFVRASTWLTSALELLPLTSPHSLQREDQQYSLAQFAGLAAEAAAYTLEAGLSPYQALCNLELGRGMIMGFAIDLRSDSKRLEAAHPDLFSRFQHLRSRLGEKRASTDSSEAVELATESELVDSVAQKITHRQNQEDSYSDFERLVTEIRALNGYSNFLQPPHEEQMRALAKDGPIVVVNVVRGRADVILITRSHIESIKLEEMSEDQPDMIQKALVTHRTVVETGRADEPAHVEDRDEMLSIHRELKRQKKPNTGTQALAWLWKTCVHPVLLRLNELGQISATGESRVWWIGTGAATALPFHAAGLYSVDCHRKESPNQDLPLSCLDWVISSYAPTIKALAHAKERARRLKLPSDISVLMATMAKTPGHSVLPGVIRETLSVEKSICNPASNGVWSLTSLSQPTVEEVLTQIPTSHIVHFACHGISNSLNPLQSSVVLERNDGNEGSRIDRLTVGSLLENMAHSQGWIIYLSACSTAEVKAPKLADEGLHLVSAFQISGFAHAIGSLWSAEDYACAAVAQTFYESLRTFTGPKELQAPAAAIRAATLKLRKQYEQDPSIWAPFVHFGA